MIVLVARECDFSHLRISPWIRGFWTSGFQLEFSGSIGMRCCLFKAKGWACLREFRPREWPTVESQFEDATGGETRGCTRRGPPQENGGRRETTKKM